MPDVNVDPDALRDADTGKAILTREHAQQEREEWTAQHPPVPGLRWILSFDVNGDVAGRRLEVIPGWEDAYAPARATSPSSLRQPETITELGAPERLGALAYAGWFSALPDVVRESGGTEWDDLAEQFREPMRRAGIIVWQHAENAGFHEALLRTLPAGQLGAAGELENLADYLAAVAKLYPGHYEGMPDILAEIRSRVARLRRDAQQGAARAREKP